ncbi:MAG TPA: sialidase family protein [Chloroflexota bacterium]|nr:sialidase family protein [Chloroflexota bacterium]
MRFRVLTGLALAAALATAGRVAANSAVTQISADPYDAPTPGQHHTEVEPDIASYGGTMVSAFQMGRNYGGGSTDVGWATSSGAGWQTGPLPGLTVNSTPPGSYLWASDPAVAYDAAHGTWIISSLGVGHQKGLGVSVNRSPDGVTWGNAIPVVASGTHSFDKDWIACDSYPSSPYYGTCYIEYDDITLGDTPFMTTSTDGGQTWSAPQKPRNGGCCIGGQPVVQPDGTVVVPIDTIHGMGAFRSTDGGASWQSEVKITSVRAHDEAGHLRASHLPSATVDAAGKVYLVWKDCNFEADCSANDIVMSTSTDGVHWSAVTRIPIDPVGSGVDHFIPGIGADQSTGGNRSSTHLALTYYYYPVSNCDPSCQLDVGYVSSTDGGDSWSAPQQLAGPMSPTWLASTSSGYMVGDYIATTIQNGLAYPAFAVAQAPSGDVLDEAMYSSQLGVTGASAGATLLLRRAR